MKTILWDFQDTLAHNDYMFSKALHKVLVQSEPATTVRLEDFKKRPMMGFTWQDHEREYFHLTNSDNWWRYAEHIFCEFYVSFGIEESKAAQLARLVRAELVKADEFCLYDDTIEMLGYFKQQDFQNVILSNHIPELELILEKLDLTQFFTHCITSAKVGYEKPNPGIYQYALQKIGSRDDIWMVGDSIAADVRGAEAVGIQGILVRKQPKDTVKYFSKDLRGLKDIIL